MKILFTLRPEIFSSLIMLYLIIYDRYAARFRKGRDEFLPIALVAFGHCVMAMVTEITVNLPGTPELVNRGCHILFFVFALQFSQEYLKYSLRQILPDDSRRKAIIRVARILSMAAIILMVVSRIDYLPGMCTNRSTGLAPALSFLLAFVYLLAADVIFVIYRKRINRVIYLWLFPVSIVGLAVMSIQILIPEFLYSAEAMTLITVGCFFVLENPVGKFQDRAFVDHNTQLWNRNGYEYDLEHKLPEQLKKGCSFIYLMADVNGLKAVNDSLGHLEGDKLIEQTAQILHKELRSAEKLYRVGGDEFVALYMDRQLETVAEEAEKAAGQCGGIRLSRAVPCGISIGYAERLKGESIEELSKRAEHMMYDRKREFYSSGGFDRRMR